MPNKRARRLLWLMPAGLIIGLGIALAVNHVPPEDAIKNAVIHNESDLANLATQISSLIAVDCGSYTASPFDHRYPFSGDQCATDAYRDGKPFRVHACYWMTDTAGCYWIVGTPEKEIYFLLYTYYAYGDFIGPPYGCKRCQEGTPVMKRCDDPVIVTQRGIESIQCLSFPNSWFDTFHIGITKGGD